MEPLPFTNIPGFPCPCCGTKNERVTGVDLTENKDGSIISVGLEENAIPKEGDWTMCYKCHSILVFNADLSVRFPNPDEEIPNCLEVVRNKITPPAMTAQLDPKISHQRSPSN